jgi:hypothetical protein
MFGFLTTQCKISGFHILTIYLAQSKEGTVDGLHSIIGNAEGKVACQTPPRLSSREIGRYGLQIVKFPGVKNEGKISETCTFYPDFLFSSVNNNGRCPNFIYSIGGKFFTE